jgi:Vacuolar protein sorting-associated protein 62/Beta/Gamma crystallin
MSTVTVYKDSNYGGSSRELGVGRYNTSDLGIGNDELSSLKVGSGLKATLYKDADFSGSVMICVQDTPDVGKNVTDQISSIVVEEYSSPGVIVYADSNYQGWSQELAVGSYDKASLTIGNDKLSSIIVPSGYVVTVYEDSGFSGKSMTLTSSAVDLGNVNDEVSSLVIAPATTATGVIIYGDSAYGGWNKELAVGSYNLSDLGIGNDTLSSLKVPTGYKVTLYRDSNFGGDSMIAVADMSSLDAFGFNDLTSSIKVEQMTAVSGPTLAQLQALIAATGPKRYFNPKDEFGPSSVDWFLQRATLVSSNGSTQPASNGLPTTGSDDGSNWLTIPTQYRGGDLSSAVAYVNAKYQNAYYIDLQYWFFYPYNGGGTGTVTVVEVSGDIDLTPMGEHGGDWEHATFRVELATKDILAVYMAQHDSGNWYTPGALQYENGVPVIYSSKHGHATYKDEGKHLTNDVTLKAVGVTWFQFGLRNDTDNGTSLDCRTKYQIVAADWLGSQVTAPQWLSYPHRWGPHIEYTTAYLKNVIEVALDPFDFGIYPMDEAVDAIYDALPDEMKEEDGPTGPKFKKAWSGTES